MQKKQRGVVNVVFGVILAVAFGVVIGTAYSIGAPEYPKKAAQVEVK